MDNNVIEVTFFLVEAALIWLVIIGNGTTIIVQSLNRSLFDEVSSHLIVNLTIADLFIGLAYLHMVVIFLTNPANKYACLVCVSCMHFAITASFYATLAIAINRYVAIVYPLKYTKYVARRMVNAMIVASWCAAVLISSVLLYWNNYDPEKGNCKDAVPKLYYEVIWTPNFMVTWFSIFVLYLEIAKATRAHMERSKARSRGTTEGNNTSDKSSNLVFLFLGCFTICWLPHVVTRLLKLSLHLDDRSTTMIIVNQTSVLMAMSNGVINPLIYAWKTPAYREAYQRVFKPKALNDNNHNNNLEVRTNPDVSTTRISRMWLRFSTDDINV
ncbi:adenosine receptor A2a-like [Copidosoma floridanum]|uniref:adenosine receptor A2a-like n=1 Tax=Copidosoma floridanum TaxID=29053 RepID=UPI0006C9CE28|nr:adenosine receptor A2a-like [Copidosoma floridanum]